DRRMLFIPPGRDSPEQRHGIPSRAMDGIRRPLGRVSRVHGGSDESRAHIHTAVHLEGSGALPVLRSASVRRVQWRIYCYWHRPLDASQKDYEKFIKLVRDDLERGNRDFSGVAFPGGGKAEYDFRKDGTIQLQECHFAPGVL